MNNCKELPQALLEDAQQKWAAFKKSAESANTPVSRDPIIVSSMRRVFAFSDFVAESCIRDPSLLHDLIQSGDLQRHYSPDDFVQPLVRKLKGLCQEDELKRILRKFRRREMVRIAWRDLDGRADLAQTVADLSSLADACLEQTYRLLFQWQCEKFGTPTAADGSAQNLVILGLGKLGCRDCAQLQPLVQELHIIGVLAHLSLDGE